jgi:CRP-like cAMP-binding protein
MPIPAFLAKTRLFRGATRPQLVSLAERCAVREAARGERVLERGERLAGIYIVTDGMLKLSLQHAPGDERVLRLVEPGQSFGVSAALLERGAPYDARALAPSRLLILPAAAVYGLIEKDPAAARRTVRELAGYCEELLAELDAGGLRGAQRLAAYLGALARPANGAWTAHLPAAKTVIAARLDMKKETFSRLLRALADQRVIEVTQGDITILDRARLAALAQGDGSEPVPT